MPRLKAAAPDAAVIVVTGYADLQGAIAALRQGATDYILKPLNPDVLRTSLARIAERRQLALAKERSEAAFRHLVEAAECMIVILRPDHTIVYFSPFAEQLTGYSAAEVRGRDYLELFLPEADRRAGRRRSSRGSSPGSPTRGFENPVVCRDGSRRSMVWNARYLRRLRGRPGDPQGRPGHHVPQAGPGAGLQAERLAAIGEMVAGLAHESRNALQRSQACLEMLALAVRDRPEALDLIDRIQKAQDHLHHLYEDVRSYAAPIKLDRVPCDLRTVWREAWAHLEPAREEKQAALRRGDRRRRPALRRRPVPPRAGLPQHPGQRPGGRLAPGRHRGPRRGGRARRPARDPHRRPRQRPGHRARAASRRSSTRSSPPRPRGPAWAWPSPSGSSRPTAARSPSATATRPAPIFLITLPRGPP